MDKEEVEFLRKCYADYLEKSAHYNNINRYYYGNTDSLANFEPKEGRSNLKVNTNFIQKLVDEEAQYSFGNDVTYTSIEDNDQIIKDINYYLKGNKADHDINLGIELIKYGITFEISYLEEYAPKEFKFKNRIVSPLDGYMYIENDVPKYFLHMFHKQLEPEKTYIDVYTNKTIYHFDETWKELSKTKHYFGIVPVGIGMIGGNVYNIDRGYEEGDKTIYATIKKIQDALETNLSDIVCEISDFRNAIMKIYGVEAEDEVDSEGNPVIDSSTGKVKKKEPVIRNNCIMLFGDKTSQDAEWLIKNVNDTFIKNTRDDLLNLIYTLTSHIDNNEKMSSNLSGIALRSKLQCLEAKCSMNEKAMQNIIYTRLYCLFKYLYITESKEYDVNTIKIQFTPNVPVDETGIADMISKLAASGIVSKETMCSWLPRIENPVAEREKVKKEAEENQPKMDLDNIQPVGEEGAMNEG
ncbi:MAG: phage portal protein [Bacilli bacterium]